MNETKTGDLVYIIDPNNHEPIMMGIGLVIGETKIYEAALGFGHRGATTPVLWDGKVCYLDKPHWMLEVLSADAVSQGSASF